MYMFVTSYLPMMDILDISQDFLTLPLFLFYFSVRGLTYQLVNIA